jgi:hypothetical protein
MSRYKKILLATAALAVSFTVAAHSGDSAKAASPKSAAQDLTMALIDANSQYAAAEPGDKGLHLGQLIKAARDRHDALSALIDSDPAEVLKVTLPVNLRATFPGEAAPFLEQDAQEDGTLEFYDVDNINPANTVAPTYAASAPETIAIAAALAASVITDKGSYLRPAKGNQTVNATITTNVLSGGAPLCGAAVSVKVTDSKGSSSTLSATTNRAGNAVVSYTIKMKGATGTYNVNSSAKLGTRPALRTRAPSFNRKSL